jgi:hypothetical protein
MQISFYPCSDEGGCLDGSSPKPPERRSSVKNAIVAIGMFVVLCLMSPRCKLLPVSTGHAIG